MEIIALLLAIIGIVISFIGMVLSLTRPDPKEKVLLVDDEEEKLQNLVEFLKEQFDVRTASTVERAEQLLIEEDFNYATIDLKMKAQNPMYEEWGGIEIFQFIKASRHNTQVIVLSAHSLDEVKKAKFVREAQEMQKVFIPKDASNHISAVLDKLMSYRQLAA